MNVDLLFELPDGGHGLFTTRTEGNLSSVGGDRAEDGLLSRERLRVALGVRRFVRGYQVHGTVVGRVFEEGTGSNRASGLREADDVLQPAFEADGHAVSARETAAMVLIADCVPVLLGAEGAVAAIHAGWRGLAAGVLEEGVRALRDVGGRGEVLAVIGPCAGVCCFEVGEEVHTAFGGVHRRGRAIDLKVIARDRLLAAGVGDVRDVDVCTICDERFFSYRREGDRSGRQAGLAWRS